MHLGALCAANAPDRERERERRARDVPARTRLHAYRTTAGPRINKLHVRACKKQMETTNHVILNPFELGCWKKYA